MIKRTYVDRSKDTILPLYKSLVRPHLDYGTQAWRPYHQCDIDMLEAVQRRALRMIDGYEHLSYNERLTRCNLMSLEMRRLRGDLIEVHKIMNGVVDIDYRKLFTLDNETTRKSRGHPFKLKVNYCRLDVRKYFFTNRVIREWNALPRNVVMARSSNEFKNEVDKILLKKRGNYMSPKGLPFPLVQSIVTNRYF